MKSHVAAQATEASKEVLAWQATLVLFPLWIFMLTLLMVYILYVSRPFWFIVYVAVLGTIGSLGLRRAHFQLHRRLLSWAGLCLLAGSALGLGLYYGHWVFYYRYHELPRHTNVAASQLAESFADAGMLKFTSDSRVDVSRAVGYESLALGERLCVAPIVDGAMSPLGPVSFFAAGRGDCCGWRGEFACGDADAVGASALLLLNPDFLTMSPALTFLVDDPGRTEGFEDAVRLQRAVYGGGSMAAGQTRLVRWTRDPVKMQDAFWWAAAWRAAVYCGVVSLILLGTLCASPVTLTTRGAKSEVPPVP